MLDYDALMAFCVFADHLNFTHAARSLRLSQPALHKKVRKLADEIGDPLYVRRGRRLVLTEGGEVLAAHGRAIASQSRDVLAQVRGDERRGEVALAAGPGALLYLLGPVVARARRGPFSLSLLPRNGSAALDEVATARAHVAIGAFASHHEGLTFRQWRVFEQMVVAPRDHHLARQNRIQPTDLQGESLIVAPSGMRHRVSTERVLTEQGVDWRVGVEATGWDLMVHLVTLGAGVCIINEFVPLPDGLVGIPVEGFDTIRYEIATREGAEYAGTRWLVELLDTPDAHPDH